MLAQNVVNPEKRGKIQGTVFHLFYPNLNSSVLFGMTGGKIIVSGSLDEPMPTFTIDNIKPKVKLDETETITGPFYVFVGDLAENSSAGKLFVSKAKNPLLGIYERFL